MATTFYTLQQRYSNSGEWITTDFRKGKKGTVVAQAEKVHAQDKFAVQVVTDAGNVVFELKSRKRVVTKFTKPFTVTVDPVFSGGDQLEGYEFAYTRPRTGTSVLRNMEADPSERYAVTTNYGEFLAFCDTTREAGAIQTAYGKKASV